MPTAVFLLIVLMGIAAIVGAIYLATVMANRPAGPSRRERDLENLVDNIRELAYENRDVEPDLSYKITDAIKNFNRKELS